MPPKKTKKTKKQATNSARGYSTTSAPSKNKEALKNEIESIDSQVSSTISESSITESVVSSKQTQIEENINEEESYINSIIENFQDLDLKKVDAYFKDSQDLVKSGNLNDNQVLSLDSNIEHKILSFIKEVGYQELDQSINLYTNNLLPKERIISSLNKLYLILLRLGFSRENIKESLRNLNSAEVKDALDWLCIHLPSEDLPAGFVDKIYYEKGMNISATRSTTPETPQLSIKKGDVVSKEKQSSVQPSSSTSKPKRTNIVEKDMKDWILNRLENDVFYLISLF
ncbi:hypothetical protein C1645_764122 [Glomus cerebriforme]|uniref:ATP-dependent RNA helicase DHX29-like UBA domain-containing protein n=1 Tax=Glomus cerebriforme TaxID=658196 RepID=A0A397T4P8_9GLOM|nr:hypothetical protein C1645_764122 [Glomus cerebriforme]